MIRRASYIPISFFMLLSFLYGGNTGKLIGLVKDKTTDEPLAGVNVLILDSPMGGATDVNGEYFILNISPGTYNVECNYIGYQPMVYENVQISSDQTTVINFDLVELDEVFEELKNDLKDDSDNEEVIEAMIQNYRLKLQILNEMLEQLNKANKDEENSNEHDV